MPFVYKRKRKRKRYDSVLWQKAPTLTEMSKGQSDKINNATKKFDYTEVADKLRTVSWSNYGYPTGVVNLVYGPNLPTPRNSRVIKRTHIGKTLFVLTIGKTLCVNKPLARHFI